MNATSQRALIRWRIFNERTNIGEAEVTCELCGKRKATDLHEILNRVHYPPELIAEVPDALLACLCNRCNVTVADTRSARKALLQKNVDRYGIDKVAAALKEFGAKVRGLDPDLKLMSLLD